jgi:lipopolysaccharide/colanic/teichoic acid biosynthesis glycosyltransferase
MGGNTSIGRRRRADVPGDGIVSTSGPCVKRIFDIAVATIALLVLAPLNLVVSVAIKVTSRGPVFIREPVYGYKNRAIQVLKFRSTTARAKDDCINSRVTRVGQVLRRTGIDGLPQLFNVLRGDMSIVGPRPYTSPQHLFDSGTVSMLDDVKPGMTGWQQITAYRDGFVPLDQRINDDLHYAKHWSLVRDIEIILKRLLS